MPAVAGCAPAIVLPRRGVHSAHAALPARRATLLLGREAHEVSAQEDVEVAVRPLPDFTNTLLAIDEQLLLGDHPIVLQDQTHEMLTGHRANEEVAFPLGKLIARIKRHARRADRRHSVVDGLLDALHRRLTGAHSHVRASVSLARVVLPAVADVGPAVVAARSN